MISLSDLLSLAYHWPRFHYYKVAADHLLSTNPVGEDYVIVAMRMRASESVVREILQRTPPKGEH